MKTKRSICSSTIEGTKTKGSIRSSTIDDLPLLHREGGGEGRVEPERRLEGQQFTKLGQKHQSINSDKHLPQSPFTGQFLDDNILL
jgi:hypothetical protein